MTTYQPPMCISCKHFHRDGLTCAAYPDGIPGDIIESRVDHRNPYPGDNGIQYDPVSPTAAEYVEYLFPKRGDEN